MLEFQISTIALTVLNLLILYVILRKLLFGRVNKVLDDRAALIQQTLDEAKGEKRKADELKQEYEDRLAQARSEANGILAQAKTVVRRSTRPFWPRLRRMRPGPGSSPRPVPRRSGTRCCALPGVRWPSWPWRRPPR